MQPRLTIIEQFSSFAWFEQDDFRGWQPKPHLVRSMELHLEQAGQPEAERFWALYWHRQWCEHAGPKALASLHLTAYLQETCYWVAQELYRSSRRPGATALYGRADFFQMALAELQPLLHRFNAKTSNNFKSFARSFLSCQLKAVLRERQEASFASRWGLLRRSSKKRVRETLTQQGMGAPEIERYQFLWMTFKALYESEAPTGSKLTDPKPEHWQEIADFYNKRRVGQLQSPGPALSGQQAAERLLNLSSWIRKFCYPETSSLDEQLGEDSTQQRLEQLAETQGSLVDVSILREQAALQEARQMKVQQILAETFQQLPEQSQQILCLLNQQQLSQQAIAKQLDMTQPTVSRRLNQARAKLVKALLVSMAQEMKLERETAATAAEAGDLEGTLDSLTEDSVNNLPSPKRLKEIRPLLDACLTIHLRSCCP